MKLFVDMAEAENAMAELQGQLGFGAVSRACRMAINDTMRLQRTKLRQLTRERYNFPAEKVKTIDFRPAADYNLTAKMGAAGKPVQLAYFKPIFQGPAFTVRGAFTKKKGFSGKVGKAKANADGGVTVEIKKGDRVNIPFAFMVPKFALLDSPLVFARGRYEKRKGFVRGKPRFPISALATASVFGAVFGNERRPQIEKTSYVLLEKKAVEYMQKMRDGIIK